MPIDFHSHILPKIDDGSRSVEESVKILDVMGKTGTEIVVATPHFYCAQRSAEEFIRRRDSAYESLRPHLKKKHPKIVLGAEVLYDPSLVNYDRLPELCIEGTGWLLLEMPYTDLDDRILDGVAAIVGRGDVKVLVAHIERYLRFTSMKRLEKLMDLELLGQMNARSLTASFLSKRRCVKLLDKGFVHVLGSDYHRIGRGDVAVLRGYESIAAVKRHSGFAEYAEDNGKRILSDQPIDVII